MEEGWPADDPSGGEVTMDSSETLLYGFDVGPTTFWLDKSPPGDSYTNVGANATLDWVEDRGPDGKPGTLRLIAPFTDHRQLVQLETTVSEDGVDYSSHLLRVRVKIAGGFSSDPNSFGGAFIYVKTGKDSNWGQETWESWPPIKFGKWRMLEFDLANPDPATQHPDYRSTEVVRIGVQFGTGSGAGASETPTATLAYVDLITVAPK